MDPKTIQDLLSSGRHQECLQACQQLLQSEPENPLLWKNAGKSLLALGQLEKAQQCLTKAHQLDKNDPEITKDIGNCYLNLGSTDAAAEWYKKSLAINNNYAPAINNLANIKRQSGSNQEAADLFKRAIQADPQLIQAYTGAATSFLTLGDFDQAELFATQAIEINASIPGINEILGIIFQNKKNYQQAVKSYQKELDVNPQSSTSLLNLGLLLLQQGKAAIAIELLSRAASINPSEQCWLLLAQAYQSIGKPKEAIAEYKKLDLRETQNKTIPFNLGLCLLNTGNNIDAIEAFKIAIQLDESFVPAWGNIGTALMNEDRHQEALPVTQKVLELKPDNSDAHMNLGSIYRNLGNLDQALASTLKSLELKPDNPTAHMNLSGIYKDLGNLDQALASTLKSLELKPDNPTAHMNLGGIYKELGNLDQALASTLKSLELKPDNPTAHMNLGWIYQDLRQLDQALASTLKSLELKPDNPTAHMNLGGIYKELGNLDQALASTLQSLELKPDNPTAHMNLGGIYKDLGNLDQALASTLQSLELKPNNADAHMNLGSIYRNLRNLDQALASTLKSLELKPDNPTAHMNLGGIYKVLGMIQEARKSIQKAAELEPLSLEKNIKANMILDMVYKDNKHIDICRENFKSAINEILRDKSLNYGDEAIDPGFFWLAYHNRSDDKQILESLSHALTSNKSLQEALGAMHNKKRNYRQEDRIRVGVVSDFLGHHAVGMHFENLIQYLCDSGMEVFIFSSPSAKEANAKLSTKSRASRIRLPLSIKRSCDIVRSHDIDILLYSEIGMSPHTLTLALARMAPVQALMAGHPCTSGMKSIDYFISSELMECPGNQKFYTEQLVLLTKLPSTMKFPTLPEKIINRSEMGLPESQVLIGFPHSLFKIHPDFDHILEAIAKKNKNVRFIFVNSPCQHMAGQVQKRWMNSAPSILSHSIFLDPMPVERFLMLLSNLDFILDPLYFGSGTVFMHSIAVGTPVVSMSTTQMRSRSALGCYRQMKMANPPVAESIKDYIQLCYELSISASAREKLREQIHATKHHLFDDAEVLYQWRQFIVDAVECSDRGVKLPFDWRPN